MHKETLDVQFQHITILAVILRTLPDEALYAMDTEVRSLAFAARVAVINKVVFKQRIQFVDDEMMDNPITEIGSKYFAFDRFVDDKCYRFARLITAIVDFIAKLQQIGFVI